MRCLNSYVEHLPDLCQFGECEALATIEHGDSLFCDNHAPKEAPEVNERVRRVQELRRSNASVPVPGKKHSKPPRQPKHRNTRFLEEREN